MQLDAGEVLDRDVEEPAGAGEDVPPGVECRLQLGDLTGIDLAAPVPFSLRIGNDEGLTMIVFTCTLGEDDDHDGRGRDDDDDDDGGDRLLRCDRK